MSNNDVFMIGIVFAILALLIVLIIERFFGKSFLKKLEKPKTEPLLSPPQPKFVVLVARNFADCHEKLIDYMLFKLSTDEDEAECQANLRNLGPRFDVSFPYFGGTEFSAIVPVERDFVANYLDGIDHQQIIERCFEAGIPLTAVFFTQKSCASMFAEAFGGMKIPLNGKFIPETRIQFSKRYTKRWYKTFN